MASSDYQHQGPALPHIASKRLPATIKFPFAAYSNAHDLLAVVTSTWDISVFRIASGQLAFTVRQRSKTIEVTALAWKPDSSCLGVGWSDGTYGVYDGESGKQIAMGSLRGDGEEELWKLDLALKVEEKKPEVGGELGKVACFGWMGHDLMGLNGVRRPKGWVANASTEDWFDGVDDDENGGGMLDPVAKGGSLNLSDLPRAITTLDATKVLPRLSTIASHSTMQAKQVAAANKFSTQQATDNMFSQGEGEYAHEAVQSLVVCQDSGESTVLLDETVRIGTCTVQARPILHAAHAESPSHAILSEHENRSHSISLIDLPLPTLGGPVLHVITSNTKRIQTLLEYIVQIARCIDHDWKTNIVVQNRFVGSLEGLLENEDEPDAIANLYHLAMTGAYNPQLLEWITDVIRDQNQKRWDQAMSALYTNIQAHIFANMLPALDRITIAITTLRGLATLHEGSSKFDCEPELFSKILAPIDSLRLVAQHMQLAIQSEYRQFKAFLRWLKMQVEISVAEPLSASALEAEDREVPNLDFSLILPYIQNVLRGSKLKIHIEQRPGVQGEASQEEFFASPIIRDVDYEKAKVALKKLEDVDSGEELVWKVVEDPAALLNIPALVCALSGHIRVALKKITEWQSRMLPKPIAIPLQLESGATVSDMKLQPPSHGREEAEGSTTTLLLIHDNTNTIEVLSVTSESYAFSKRHSTQQFQNLPTSFVFPISLGEILDCKFIPTILGTRSLFVALIRADDGQVSILLHCSNVTGEDPAQALEGQILHVFPSTAQFRPMRMLVGGRRKRLVVVVFENKGREWRVLDLEAALREWRRRGGVGEGTESMEIDA
ncbi:hypothetical protein DOTSEDRAFT_42370 [Dothistroma septosporum NZE10]|uniref:Anaphase-promoting complex subunit 4 n=1 Tax=Dothistroma septosporum (strain NZE10 / CBS 128990) TaxID=675120 RepID=N1PXF7_DOTSN|nr:hypothetical protein DOTSEDRAFT_42370 [Dothistroma septosporum NZE10]